MEQEKKLNGTLIGSIIIIIILIVGGIYTWQSKAKQLIREKEAREQTIQANEAELNQLEADLSADSSGSIDYSDIQ
ncbi:MAG: hypothetical protein KBD55_02430 [Candidatus Pacebacteria bacterium]|jgi:Na+/alanine symporter|nr:hypothetical protein [Candidatus Paceibacterota bacterium]